MNIVYVLENLHWFVLLVGGLVFFHELGHFLIAKACKVKVLRFSLGFGPRLFGFERGGTEYRVSLLPLGGYVKMLGDMPGAHVPPEHKHVAFDSKPVWQRSAIILAGPMFNFLLAVVVLFALFWGSQSVMDTRLGYVVPGEVAWNAGLRTGDRVLSVNNKPVQHWGELREAIGARPEESIELHVERGGRRELLRLEPAAQSEQNLFDELETRGRIGVSPAFLKPVIGIVDPESPAARAGFATDDLIVAVAGASVETWEDVRRHLSKIPEGVALDLVVRRGEQTRTLQLEPAPAAPAGLRFNGLADDPQPLLSSADTAWGYTGLVNKDSMVVRVKEGTPAAEAALQAGDRLLHISIESDAGEMVGRPIGMWGVDLQNFQGVDARRRIEITYQRGTEMFQRPLKLVEEEHTDELKNTRTRVVFGAFNDADIADTYVKDLHRGPLQAFQAASREAWRDVTLIGKAIGMLVQGKLSFDTMGGPIMLFVIAEKTAKRGAADFIRTMAFISVNLGLINLFPIPVLDGGHLLFCGIEAVRRRPPSVRVREVANLAGFVLLVMLMVLVFKNDILRYILG